MARAFIRKIRSAGHLPKEDEYLLLKACSEVRPFPARSDIVREGESPECVFLIMEGWACRYQVLHDGSRQITAFLVPGDFCDGHIPMFDRMDHSIGSVTECKVALIPRATMDHLTGRPAIARAFWWANLVDEAVLRAWIVNLGRRNAADRVAHLICEMHARLRNVGYASGGAFELPLSQEELGDTLGITGVHVNRTLRKLREANIMTFRNHQITITDMAALRARAGFDPNYLHLH